MTVATNGQRQAAAVPRTPGAQEISLIDLFGVLRRYTFFLIACLALGIGGAVATLAWLEPIYVATAQLMIQPTRAVGAKDAALAESGIADDSAAIDSQVKLLASRSLAREVIAALELDVEPEMQRSLDVTDRAATQLGIAQAAAGSATETSIVDRFLERLSVDRDGASHVIRVGFESSNPALAARVANGVAERYISGRLETKATAARGAAAWLARAMDASQTRLQKAEAALAAYRAEARLENRDSAGVDGGEVADLRRDVAAAAAERAAREARLRRIREVVNRPGGDLAFEALGGSSVLENLYALKNQTTRREAELATRYGERHPQILDVRAERRELEQRIRAEQQALVGRAEAEIAAARASGAALARELEAIKEQSRAHGATATQIVDLERDVALARQQYETYLARYQAVTDVTETQRADARLISEATPPRRPSFPQPLVIFGLFSATSLGAGLLLVFFREQQDRGFRNQRALTQGLGQRCLASLPMVRRRRRDPLAIVDVPVALPRSRFAESLRALVAELPQRGPIARGGKAVSGKAGAGQVVLVTSSVPGEGKSTTVLALARLAASEGLEVLAIDADLRRPKLAELLGIEAEAGLVEVLRGERELEEVLTRDDATGLSIIPGSARVSQPTRLLGPQAMGILVEEARRHFDLVLIDSPPVLAVTDARVMAPLCDGIVFLVRWNATQRALASHALGQLEGVADKLLGTVLTMADMRAASALGAAESRLVRKQLLQYYAEG